MTEQTYKFEGDYKLGIELRKTTQVHPDSPKKPEPYKAKIELVQAVNLAIFLRRPLLIEGEAGCGKTRLASAVAYELGLPYYRWNIRSTTKAKEGLYDYNAILRLHDVQTLQAGLKSSQGDLARNPADPKNYRTFGAIGQAFDNKECPSVILIDEIDKADVDFPNDLLTVLDEPWSFEIRETGEVREKAIATTHKPIVMITSNKEKGNLPAPFLRRCLYYYISFPETATELEEIVNKHYEIQQELDSEEKLDKPEEELVKAVTEKFIKLREDTSLFKLPGTSEMLDWLKALHGFEQSDSSDESDQPNFVEQLTSGGNIPYPELLFKLRQDWQKYGSAS